MAKEVKPVIKTKEEEIIVSAPSEVKPENAAESASNVEVVRVNNATTVLDAEQQKLVAEMLRKSLEETSHTYASYAEVEAARANGTLKLENYFPHATGWQALTVREINGNKIYVLQTVAKNPMLAGPMAQFIDKEITNKIPKELLIEIIGSFHRVCKKTKDEAAAQIYRDDKGEYFIYYPNQGVSGSRVTYTNDTGMFENRANSTLVLELHSHNTMNAFWSGTDDANEKEVGFYMVIGLLDREKASYMLRVKYDKIYQNFKAHEIFDMTPEEEEEIFTSANFSEGNPIIDDRVRPYSEVSYPQYGYGYRTNANYGYGSFRGYVGSRRRGGTAYSQRAYRGLYGDYAYLDDPYSGYCSDFDDVSLDYDYVYGKSTSTSTYSATKRTPTMKDIAEAFAKYDQDSLKRTADQVGLPNAFNSETIDNTGTNYAQLSREFWQKSSRLPEVFNLYVSGGYVWYSGNWYAIEYLEELSSPESQLKQETNDYVEQLRTTYNKSTLKQEINSEDSVNCAAYLAGSNDLNEDADFVGDIERPITTTATIQGLNAEAIATAVSAQVKARVTAQANIQDMVTEAIGDSYFGKSKNVSNTFSLTVFWELLNRSEKSLLADTLGVSLAELATDIANATARRFFLNDITISYIFRLLLEPEEDRVKDRELLSDALPALLDEQKKQSNGRNGNIIMAVATFANKRVNK